MKILQHDSLSLDPDFKLRPPEYEADVQSYLRLEINGPIANRNVSAKLNLARDITAPDDKHSLHIHCCNKKNSGL
jgi:hypothetical protein